MINLNFSYIAAKNFMPFGPEGIELDLTKRGNIIHVKGLNMDRLPENYESLSEEDKEKQRKNFSNGVGKSSIIDIIAYTLFGKSTKEKMTHETLIHNLVGKGLRTEVIWDKYRVVRTRKPNSLRFWESEKHIWDDNSEKTLGGMPATQELIDKTIGITYDTFVNVIAFTDKSNQCFLECDTPTKREIVENLLSLKTYREYCDNAKELRNQFKESVDLFSQDYLRLLSEEKACQAREASFIQQEAMWKKTKHNELASLNSTLKVKESQLIKTDVGAAIAAFNNAQDEIKKLSDTIPALQKNVDTIKDGESKCQKKLAKLVEEHDRLSSLLREYKYNIENAKTIIVKSNKEIESHKSRKNTKCPYCRGVVKEENYQDVIQECEKDIAENKKIIDDAEPSLSQIQKEISDLTTRENEMNKMILAASQKIREIESKIHTSQQRIYELNRIKKPDANADVKVIESQVESIKKQIEAKQQEIEGVSPYHKILQDAIVEHTQKKLECQEKKKELDSLEKDLPYYEFWVDAFGDKGIRKFIIDRIIPTLNKRIAYWLQFLIDGKIKLKFNNELQETIERNPSDGDPFVYSGMSGGEKRRINLAISQAFAYVMMIDSGSSPSLVFLDEVTSNIDPDGVQGVYNMVMELAKTKQVFITTHDKDFQEMLTGCDTISLVRQGGFTKLVS